MSRFIGVIRNNNIQILIVYRGFRSILYLGSGLFTFYVLFVLSLPPTILGIIISVGFLASMLGSIFGGYLTDKVERKHTLVVSSLLAGCGWILLSLSRYWIHVAFSYGMINGMMVCAYPAYTALVSDSVPEDVGGGLGILNTVTGIIWSIGAFLAATTARYLGFGSLFVFISFPYFLSAFIILKITERKLAETGKPFKRAHLNPFCTHRKSPNLFILSFSALLVTFGLYSVNFYPDYVEKAFKISPVQIGIFDSIYAIVWAITNYPMGLLSDKVGRKKVITLGYTIMGLAWGLFPIPHSLFGLFILYSVYSLGSSMGSYISALAIDITSEQKKGTAVGIVNSFMYIGVLLSGIIGGILWENLGALTSFYISFLLVIVAALIINFLVMSPEPNSRKF